ncbi:unnamed protein product, partial [Oppiella nova]
GRSWKWYRRLSIFRHFASYFPLKLVKTHDLNPDKNYIFACHPHGIIALSHIYHFTSNSPSFQQLFNGFTVRMCGLMWNFWFPLCRDSLMAIGFISSNKSSIEWCVSGKEGTGGQVVAVIVGGGREAHYAMPYTMRLCLKHRKGFVKIALKHGASLVPVLAFGENELWEQKVFTKNSWFGKCQQYALAKCYVTIPILKHILPWRRPVTTVVGKPIDVPKVDNPTDDEVNQLHNQYINSLEKLFHENKAKYGFNDVELIIDPGQAGVIRPLASTPVASLMTSPAPPRAYDPPAIRQLGSPEIPRPTRGIVLCGDHRTTTGFTRRSTQRSEGISPPNTDVILWTQHSQPIDIKRAVSCGANRPTRVGHTLSKVKSVGYTPFRP